MACILVTLRLGLHDLFSHRRLALVMALSIAIAFGMLAILEVYRTGVADKYTELAPDLLLVHESQTLGEFYGSRLSSQVGDWLSGMGFSMLIPEIHALTGTSARNAILLRGIDLGQYTRLESFSILEGRRLQPGDPPRQAMIGWRLARSRELKVGDVISLRGRDFDILGIFQNGTYMDNQAWISLADAQALLGWGQDVSIYIIPDGCFLHEGQQLPNGISVSRKGASLKFVAAQLQPILDLLRIVVAALGIATALALTNTLWRLGLAAPALAGHPAHHRFPHFFPGGLPPGAGRRHYPAGCLPGRPVHIRLHYQCEVRFSKFYDRSPAGAPNGPLQSGMDWPSDVSRQPASGLVVEPFEPGSAFAFRMTHKRRMK